MVLVGGTVNGTGNVFAKNPVTGIYGPVCDDFWDINDVSFIDVLCCLNGFTTNHKHFDFE